jgi:iron complex outermembrane receptor protein
VLLDVHLLPAVLSRPAAPADSKSRRTVVAKDGLDESVSNPNDLFLELKADYVHAEDRDSGEALPRITPLRMSIGLGYASEHWVAKTEGTRVQSSGCNGAVRDQHTGYTLLSANVSYQFHYGPQTYEVFLRGTNLSNEEARNHENFLKDVLPLPGRNIVGGLRVTF